MSKTIAFAFVLLAVASPFWPAAPGAAWAASTGIPPHRRAAGIVPVQQLSIRFYDQKVYFLGDPIQVEAVITNTGTDTLRFKVADNRFFNLDFDVRTTTNVGLDHAKEFTIARNSDQPVFFREMSLEPGEKYGIVVDLTTYARFPRPGQYVLQATFFPELFRGPDSSAMKSNRLALNVKPPVATAEEKAVVEAETGALLARQVAPPGRGGELDDLRAAEEPVGEVLPLPRPGVAAEEEPRQGQELPQCHGRGAAADGGPVPPAAAAMTIQQDISVIPSSFEIQKTTYDAAEATVQVLEKFKYPDYTELKAYTYHLKKIDRYWIINDYEIRNLGTE